MSPDISWLEGYFPFEMVSFSGDMWFFSRRYNPKNTYSPKVYNMTANFHTLSIKKNIFQTLSMSYPCVRVQQLGPKNNFLLVGSEAHLPTCPLFGPSRLWILFSQFHLPMSLSVSNPWYVQGKKWKVPRKIRVPLALLECLRKDMEMCGVCAPWICLRSLEKRKPDLPNGGALIWMYHGHDPRCIPFFLHGPFPWNWGATIKSWFNITGSCNPTIHRLQTFAQVYMRYAHHNVTYTDLYDI